MLANHGTADLNGREYPLRPGDLLHLPLGTTHGFISGSEALEILDIHAPGCRPDHDVFVDDKPAGSA